MFKGRQNDTQEFRKVMNEVRIEVTKGRGKGFWDPCLQSKLGKRGGSKGGSANTSDQYQARQKVGNTYGRSSGKQRQSDKLAKVLSEPMVLQHKTGLFITVHLECAEDLREELSSLTPNLPKCSPSGMLMGGKSWGGWVVNGRSFDKRHQTKPSKWASVKGNLTRYGFTVGQSLLFPKEKEYRIYLSETFMEYCRLYGNPVGSHPSVDGTARD